MDCNHWNNEAEAESALHYGHWLRASSYEFRGSKQLPREKVEDFHFSSQSVQGTTINDSAVMCKKNHEEPMLEGTEIHAVRL